MNPIKKYWKKFCSWSLLNQIAFIGGVLAIISFILFTPFLENGSIYKNIQQDIHDYKYKVFIETYTISYNLEYLELVNMAEGHTIIFVPLSKGFGNNADFYIIMNSKIYDLMYRKDKPLEKFIQNADYSEYPSMDKNHTIWKFKIQNIGYSSLTNTVLDIEFLDSKIIGYSSNCLEDKFNLEPDMKKIQFRKLFIESTGGCKIKLTVNTNEIPKIDFRSNENPKIDLIEPNAISIIFNETKTSPPIYVWINTSKTMDDPNLMERLQDMQTIYGQELAKDIVVEIVYPDKNFSIAYSNNADTSLIKDLENLFK